MEIKLLNQKFLAEEQARTGSDQFDEKKGRMYVGIYDSNTGWFIPLEGRLAKFAPKDGVFETPFENHNPHLKRPGLNLQKGIYIDDANNLIDLKNTIPVAQSAYIETHLLDIEEQFKQYTRRIVQLPMDSQNLLLSTVPFYPAGIERLIGQRVDLFGLEGEVTPYQEKNNNKGRGNIMSEALNNTLAGTVKQGIDGEQLLKEAIDQFVLSDGVDDLVIGDHEALVTDAEPDEFGTIGIRKWANNQETGDEAIYRWNGNEGPIPDGAQTALLVAIKETYPEALDYYAAKTTQVTDNRSLQEIIKAKDATALESHLENGIKQYLNSNTYKQYLKFMSQFHQYSSRNMQLLAGQNPLAQQVNTFNKWRELGRHVKKGTKALYVYAPIKKPKEDEVGHLVKNAKGEVEKVLKGYRLVPVYDVSQTEGKELVKPIYELKQDFEDPKHFTAVFKSLVALAPVPVKIESAQSFISDAKGYYSPTENKIGLRQGLGQEQTVKTLIHELTHAQLHANSTAEFGSQAYGQHEFEAESVAYVVADHLGIDSSEYSFGYLSAWTHEGDQLEAFKTSLKTVTTQANQLINKIDDTLSKTYGVTQPKNAFEARLMASQDQVKGSELAAREVGENAPKSPRL